MDSTRKKETAYSARRNVHLAISQASVLNAQRAEFRSPPAVARSANSKTMASAMLVIPNAWPAWKRKTSASFALAFANFLTVLALRDSSRTRTLNAQNVQRSAVHALQARAIALPARPPRIGRTLLPARAKMATLMTA